MPLIIIAKTHKMLAFELTSLWSFQQIITKWINLESTLKGVLKNFQNGISRPNWKPRNLKNKSVYSFAGQSVRVRTNCNSKMSKLLAKVGRVHNYTTCPNLFSSILGYYVGRVEPI